MPITASGTDNAKTPLNRAIELIFAEQQKHPAGESQIPFQQAIGLVQSLLPAEKEFAKEAYTVGNAYALMLKNGQLFTDYYKKFEHGK